MNKKIDNLKELEYYTNYNLISDVILKLKKKYPDNHTLDDTTEAMLQVGYFVQNLISDRYYFNQSMNEYRSNKLRAIERAKRAEKRVQELEKELVVYKKKEELGL